MKQAIRLVTSLILLASLVLGLSGLGFAQAVVRVGATPVPHAEILEHVVPILEKRGIKLEIVEFNDYVLPNLAVHEGELEANFFQHIPYLENFNRDHRINLVSIAGVHVEPFGLYSNTLNNVEDLKLGATIAIPNDATNGGRALLLLQQAGLIKLDPKAGNAPTVFDITENKLNLRIVELEAAQLPRSLSDVTAACINGNYAIAAGLNPIKDALVIEGKDSPYVNVLAVDAKNANNANLLKLAEALNSEAIRQFILETYDGSVVPAF